VLVDITKLDLRTRPVALLPQTRRHTLLAQLLRVPGIVFAINKLDAVDDPAAAYVAVRDALETFAQQAGIEVAGIVPVSALRGDNVTRPLDVAWYRRPSLLQLLESLPAASEPASDALSMPVQYVARQARDDTAAADGGIGDQRRTIWGRIASGRVAPGDAVEVFPSGERAVVADVLLAGGAVDDAAAGQSVGLMLDRQLDVSRGDWITTPVRPGPTQRFEATLAWLDTEPAVVGRRYQVRHGNRWVQARIAAIESRLDIRTLESTDTDSLAVNEIGRVVIETQQPLPLAPYAANRVAGALIVVDPASHRTSGALLVGD
jgi:sulfate adenylyltransferase subunit 1